jgi:hypothetical protein
VDSRVLDRFAAPELLFDFLDLFLAQTEVVAEFVDDGLGDAIAYFILVLACFFRRLLVDRDAVRQVVAERPAALGQRRALI